ncbi:hypothetical protein RN629_13860 [Sphingomonadaceae bacterium jetA1]|uniref:hypothetical protein n=1 Tax=Facivitalis istanbulensis TaxID=3075838 RepID=UPI00347167F6
MRRLACLLLLALPLTGCGQGGGAEDRLADAELQERARQEKAARDMVAQTEDQVRVKMLEQRVAALEAQVAAMEGDRKLLDARLVEQRLTQIEAQRGASEVAPAAIPTPKAAIPAPRAAEAAGAGQSRPRPAPSATPPARKPLVLDLR